MAGGLIKFEYDGKVEYLPAQPLNIVLGRLNLMTRATKFGVERWTERGWEPFLPYKKPKPGDRLRLRPPPEKPKKGLRALMLRVLGLRAGPGRRGG